ncbi:MAG TPA: serine/threonine-protein kinase [Bacteroidota bacterium]|nr:serine/threonine-protein kinase [Bacteroidota bacterium]
MLQIGDQFEHYQIRDRIAQGGMSDIYRAYDLLSGKDVVLKVPDKMTIGDPAQFERFQREMEVMRTLNHPSILKGLGSGRYNNTPYLVTELVSGESMRDFVNREAPLAPEKAIELIRKVADGLAHCHDHGIVHRDLKPENILFSGEGQPVILDFGLALTKGSYRVTYANLSGTAGTPDYMAPEQVEGKRGDARTDLYAVGIMLFEMLSGRTPFTGDNTMAVMAQHLNGAIPRLDAEQPAVSPQLAAVVARCVRRDPDERYPDMHAFIHDLDHLDLVDTSILDKAAAEVKPLSWWKSPIVMSVVGAFGMLIIIILLAILLQALHK